MSTGDGSDGEAVSKTFGSWWAASHEVIVSEGIVVVVIGGEVVGGADVGGDQGCLGLGSLGLLAALVGSLLGLHLLIAKGRQGAGHLFDLVTRELLSELLGKLLEEEGVVRLLGGGGDDGGQSVAQLLELSLSRRVEQRQGSKVDRVGRILRIEGDGSAGSSGFAAVADANLTKQVLGVTEVSLLLSTAEALAALSLSLLLLRSLLVDEGLGARGLVLSDTLSLGLLVRLGFGEGLDLGLSGLALLLALYLGILGGIPRVDNLKTRLSVNGRDGNGAEARTYIAVIFFIVELAAADGSNRRRRRRGAGLALLVIWASSGQRNAARDVEKQRVLFRDRAGPHRRASPQAKGKTPNYGMHTLARRMMAFW